MECRICNNNDLETMFCWPKFPIYIWPIEQDAEQVYEELQVYWCPECGLVQLDRFDQEFINKLYSKEVFGLVSSTEFQTTSARNNQFLEFCSNVLGAQWIDNKKVLDIGGYDVLTCVDLNFSEGVICDPNAPASTSNEKVSTVRAFFDRNHFQGEEFDVIIAKHVLEHINDLLLFMEDIRFVLKDQGTLIIEVPELMNNIKVKGSFTAFYHQHLTYFDECSIKNLLRKFGFHILDITFDKNNLRIIAQKSQSASDTLAYEVNKDVPIKVKEYKARLDQYFKELEEFLKENSKEKIICYGAGGGTTLLLNLCKRASDFIEVVVDSSKNKINKQVGGADFIIESPEALNAYSDRNILVNSDIFFGEIVDGIRKNHKARNYQILKIFSNFEKMSLTN